MIRTFITTALVALSLTAAPSAHAATVSVNADDYTAVESSGGDSGTCVLHTFDMTAEYAEGEDDSQVVFVTITDPEGTEVHRLRTWATNQQGIEMSFCRPVLLEGTYTLTAVLDDAPVTARRAMAVTDTFVVTVTRGAATPQPQVSSVQLVGTAKIRRVKDGFRVKFVGGVNVTTRFTVKVDGRPKRSVTVRAGDTKVKTYGGRRIKVRASAV